MHVNELLEYGGNFIYRIRDLFLGIQGAYYDAHPQSILLKRTPDLRGKSQRHMIHARQYICSVAKDSVNIAPCDLEADGLVTPWQTCLISEQSFIRMTWGKSCLELAPVFLKLYGTVHRTGWDWTNPGCCGCLATFAFSSQETAVLIYQGRSPFGHLWHVIPVLLISLLELLILPFGDSIVGQAMSRVQRREKPSRLRP